MFYILYFLYYLNIWTEICQLYSTSFITVRNLLHTSSRILLGFPLFYLFSHIASPDGIKVVNLNKKLVHISKIMALWWKEKEDVRYLLNQVFHICTNCHFKNIWDVGFLGYNFRFHYNIHPDWLIQAVNKKLCLESCFDISLQIPNLC